jgi:hypothetical protein
MLAIGLTVVTMVSFLVSLMMVTIGLPRSRIPQLNLALFALRILLSANQKSKNVVTVASIAR